MDRLLEPAPRRGAFSAAINSNFFLWGGAGHSDDLSCIDTFNSSSGAWTAKQTTGAHPPGYKYGTSTVVGDTVYTYGEWGSKYKDIGCLQTLNTEALE